MQQQRRLIYPALQDVCIPSQCYSHNQTHAWMASRTAQVCCTHSEDVRRALLCKTYVHNASRPPGVRLYTCAVRWVCPKDGVELFLHSMLGMHYFITYGFVSLTTTEQTGFSVQVIQTSCRCHLLLQHFDSVNNPFFFNAMLTIWATLLSGGSCASFGQMWALLQMFAAWYVAIFRSEINLLLKWHSLVT